MNPIGADIDEMVEKLHLVDLVIRHNTRKRSQSLVADCGRYHCRMVQSYSTTNTISCLDYRHLHTVLEEHFRTVETRHASSNDTDM